MKDEKKFGKQQGQGLSLQNIRIALKYITQLTVNLSQSFMDPKNNHQTPEKNKCSFLMRLIITPEKEENLYDRLIRQSPLKFPLLQQADPHSQNEPSESQFSDSAQHSHLSHSESPKQPVPPSHSKPVYTQNHFTPQKPPRLSKGCHCEKSHCQKKYCDCFKVGEVCTEDCMCIGCENHHQTEKHQKLRKVAELTRSGKGGKQIKCNCQKSHCLKNYCDCHNAGKMCSEACNCIQCDNRVDSEAGFQGKKRKHYNSNNVSSWSSKENILFN